MDPEIRDGLLLKDTSDILVYGGTILASIILFFIAFRMYHFLFESLKPAIYTEREQAARIRFLGFCVANTHHIPVVIYCSWTFFHICSSESLHPVGSSSLLWFSNSECLL